MHSNTLYLAKLPLENHFIENSNKYMFLPIRKDRNQVHNCCIQMMKRSLKGR